MTNSVPFSKKIKDTLSVIRYQTSDPRLTTEQKEQIVRLLQEVEKKISQVTK